MKDANDVVANLYVFGSCLRKETPNDIDLLWVYDNNRFDTTQALEFVNQRTAVLQVLTDTPIHNTVLSSKEETIVQFCVASQACHLVSLETKSNTLSVMARIDSLRKERGLKAISSASAEEVLLGEKKDDPFK